MFFTGIYDWEKKWITINIANTKTKKKE